MSMKSSLISAEETEEYLRPSSIELDLYDETTRLRGRIDGEERSLFHDLATEKVKTTKGDVFVAIQGDRGKKRTAIVTLHDIGQNHISCFQSFFCFHQFKPLLHNFTVFHVNFPGQEEGAVELPQDYVFPTMEEMADVVEEIFTYYGLQNTICFGVGAGANVFTRLGLKDRKHVQCLVLVNSTATTSSWSEWGHEKMSSHYLKTKGMTQFSEDYLLYHYFGRIDEQTNQDLVGMVRDDLKKIRHPRNLALFIDQFSKRSAIKITRPIPGQTGTNTLQCGVLLLTGDRSPMVDDMIDLNSKLDPGKATWIKVSDASSMVLEEQPTNVTSAVVLFLQGYGHAMKVRPPTLSFAQDEEIHAPLSIC